MRQKVQAELGEAVLLEIDETLKGRKLQPKPTEQDKLIEQELARASEIVDTLNIVRVAEKRKKKNHESTGEPKPGSLFCYLKL